MIQAAYENQPTPSFLPIEEAFPFCRFHVEWLGAMETSAAFVFYGQSEEVRLAEKREEGLSGQF